MMYKQVHLVVYDYMGAQHHRNTLIIIYYLFVLYSPIHSGQASGYNIIISYSVYIIHATDCSIMS